MDNRSLDDFLDAGDDDTEEDAGETGDADGETDDAEEAAGETRDIGPDEEDTADAEDGTTVENRAEQTDTSGASAAGSTGPMNESTDPTNEPTDSTNESGEETGESPESVDEPADPDDESVEPAVSTYVWDGAGDECAACGESVAERWHSEEGLVCRACKDW